MDASRNLFIVYAYGFSLFMHGVSSAKSCLPQGLQVRKLDTATVSRNATASALMRGKDGIFTCTALWQNDLQQSRIACRFLRLNAPGTKSDGIYRDAGVLRGRITDFQVTNRNVSDLMIAAVQDQPAVLFTARLHASTVHLKQIGPTGTIGASVIRMVRNRNRVVVLTSSSQFCSSAGKNCAIPPATIVNQDDSLIHCSGQDFGVSTSVAGWPSGTYVYIVHSVRDALDPRVSHLMLFRVDSVANAQGCRIEKLQVVKLPVKLCDINSLKLFRTLRQYFLLVASSDCDQPVHPQHISTRDLVAIQWNSITGMLEGQSIKFLSGTEHLHRLTPLSASILLLDRPSGYLSTLHCLTSDSSNIFNITTGKQRQIETRSVTLETLAAMPVTPQLSHFAALNTNDGSIFIAKTMGAANGEQTVELDQLYYPIEPADRGEYHAGTRSILSNLNATDLLDRSGLNTSATFDIGNVHRFRGPSPTQKAFEFPVRAIATQASLSRTDKSFPTLTNFTGKPFHMALAAQLPEAMQSPPQNLHLDVMMAKDSFIKNISLSNRMRYNDSMGFFDLSNPTFPSPLGETENTSPFPDELTDMDYFQSKKLRNGRKNGSTALNNVQVKSVRYNDSLQADYGEDDADDDDIAVYDDYQTMPDTFPPEISIPSEILTDQQFGDQDLPRAHNGSANTHAVLSNGVDYTYDPEDYMEAAGPSLHPVISSVHTDNGKFLHDDNSPVYHDDEPLVPAQTLLDNIYNNHGQPLPFPPAEVPKRIMSAVPMIFSHAKSALAVLSLNATQHPFAGLQSNATLAEPTKFRSPLLLSSSRRNASSSTGPNNKSLADCKELKPALQEHNEYDDPNDRNYGERALPTAAKRLRHSDGLSEDITVFDETARLKYNRTISDDAHPKMQNLTAKPLLSTNEELRHDTALPGDVTAFDESHETATMPLRVTDNEEIRGTFSNRTSVVGQTLRYSDSLSEESTAIDETARLRYNTSLSDDYRSEQHYGNLTFTTPAQWIPHNDSLTEDLASLDESELPYNYSFDENDLPELSQVELYLNRNSSVLAAAAVLPAGPKRLLHNTTSGENRLLYDESFPEVNRLQYSDLLSEHQYLERPFHNFTFKVPVLPIVHATNQSFASTGMELDMFNHARIEQHALADNFLRLRYNDSVSREYAFRGITDPLVENDYSEMPHPSAVPSVPQLVPVPSEMVQSLQHAFNKSLTKPSVPDPMMKIHQLPLMLSPAVFPAPTNASYGRYVLQTPTSFLPTTQAYRNPDTTLRTTLKRRLSYQNESKALQSTKKDYIPVRYQPMRPTPSYPTYPVAMTGTRVSPVAIRAYRVNTRPPKRPMVRNNTIGLSKGRIAPSNISGHAPVRRKHGPRRLSGNISVAEGIHKSRASFRTLPHLPRKTEFKKTVTRDQLMPVAFGPTQLPARATIRVMKTKIPKLKTSVRKQNQNLSDADVVSQTVQEVVVKSASDSDVEIEVDIKTSNTTTVEDKSVTLKPKSSLRVFNASIAKYCIEALHVQSTNISETVKCGRSTTRTGVKVDVEGGSGTYHFEIDTVTSDDSTKFKIHDAKGMLYTRVPVKRNVVPRDKRYIRSGYPYKVPLVITDDVCDESVETTVTVTLTCS